MIGVVGDLENFVEWNGKGKWVFMECRNVDLMGFIRTSSEKK